MKVSVGSVLGAEEKCWVKETAAHSSQIDCGISPARCKYPKPMQPKQIPANDSRDAAMINAPITSCAAKLYPLRHRARADVEKTNPTVCAKRFGGPGVALYPKRGAMRCTAIRPKGEKRGPAATRNKKPTARIKYPIQWLVTRTTRAKATTSPAVARAAYSFTGLGKLNNEDTK